MIGSCIFAIARLAASISSADISSSPLFEVILVPTPSWQRQLDFLFLFFFLLDSAGHHPWLRASCSLRNG